MVPKGNDGRPDNPSSRHGGRVVLSLDVERHVRDSLRDRAAAAGVSMAEYLSNALAEPDRPYATSAAATAQPLAQISYRLAQVTQALDRGDVRAARADVDATKGIVAEALVALRKAHADEARVNDSRRSGGWTG